MKVRVTVDVEVPTTTTWWQGRNIHADIINAVSENGLSVTWSKVQFVRPPKGFYGLTEMEFGRRR